MELLCASGAYFSAKWDGTGRIAFPPSRQKKSAKTGHGALCDLEGTRTGVCDEWAETYNASHGCASISADACFCCFALFGGSGAGRVADAGVGDYGGAARD